MTLIILKTFQMTRIIPKLIFMTYITPKISILLFYYPSSLYINFEAIRYIILLLILCLLLVISFQPWKMPMKRSIVMCLMKENLTKSIDLIVPAIL